MASRDPSLGESPPLDFPLVAPGKMTEDEFLAWCDEDTRAEWVDGEVVMMSPVNKELALLSGWLYRLVGEFVERQRLGAPLFEYQVRFATQARRRRPDLVFVSNEHADRIRSTEIDGPPDLIVEIVSPDSEARDWREKYLEYQTAGVPEYWVIDPMSRHVEVYALGGVQPEAQGAPPNEYRRLAEQDGVIRSTALPGFRLGTAWLWPETRPTVEAALREQAG